MATGEPDAIESRLKRDALYRVAADAALITSQNNSAIGLPSLIAIGRPMGVDMVCEKSMPSRWNIVA